MDDLSAILSNVLNSKEGQETLGQLMAILGGQDQDDGESSPAAALPPRTPEPEPQSSTPSLLDGLDMGTILRIGSMLSSGAGDDKNIALLNALRPHMSDERRGRIDSAIKIMQLMKLLPLLKEINL